MAKLIVHNPPRAKLKSSGYMGDPTGTIQITENGTFNVKPYAEADVDVQPILIEKNITENGVYLASEEEADGYSKVNVAVPQPSGEAPTITENGTYDVTDYVSVKAEVPTYEEEYRQAQADIAQDNTYFSEISTAIQGKTGQVEPYQKEDMAYAIDGIDTYVIPIDPNSEAPVLVTGIDAKGFYYSRNPNDKTNVLFGVDSNNKLYATQGGAE